MSDVAATGLIGKRTLVTGAASGIGRATGLRLAADGADVALADWNDGPAEEIVGACTAHGRRARFWRCDVSDEQAISTCIDEAAGWLDGLDVVIHVAGIGGAMDVAVEHVEMSDWDHVLGVNLVGAFLVVKHSVPHLERTRGAIILTGSGAGLFNEHRSVPYAASKAGLNGLVVTLEQSLRVRGVRINNVAVGAVDTPLTRAHRPNPAPPRPPGRELLTPESVAGLMAFLASDDAADVRGTFRTW